jgi:hypothetical protein
MCSPTRMCSLTRPIFILLLEFVHILECNLLECVPSLKLCSLTETVFAHYNCVLSLYHRLDVIIVAVSLASLKLCSLTTIVFSHFTTGLTSLSWPFH